VTVERGLELILGNLGVLILLLVILFGGFKGWWVFGWYARELRNRNERLENRLDQTSRVAERGTGLAHRAADLAERRTEAVDG
jgi:hypothetical protein